MSSSEAGAGDVGGEASKQPSKRSKGKDTRITKDSSSVEDRLALSEDILSKVGERYTEMADTFNVFNEDVRSMEESVATAMATFRGELEKLQGNITCRDEERKNLIKELVTGVDEVEDLKTRVTILEKAEAKCRKAKDLKKEGLSSGETVESQVVLKRPAPNQGTSYSVKQESEESKGHSVAWRSARACREGHAPLVDSSHSRLAGAHAQRGKALGAVSPSGKVGDVEAEPTGNFVVVLTQLFPQSRDRASWRATEQNSAHSAEIASNTPAMASLTLTEQWELGLVVGGRTAGDPAEEWCGQSVGSGAPAGRRREAAGGAAEEIKLRLALKFYRSAVARRRPKELGTATTRRWRPRERRCAPLWAAATRGG
uniref:Uncharacterized protein n=1 Tax=Ananas comosus var. bracteatus TaxID=296719 RepID=A0A6V7PRZ4_ANACO|nr:unnamed protein product [Ananas comosus var. bracteatus]